jgi:hypothetical protein
VEHEYSVLRESTGGEVELSQQIHESAVDDDNDHDDDHTASDIVVQELDHDDDHTASDIVVQELDHAE